MFWRLFGCDCDAGKHSEVTQSGVSWTWMGRPSWPTDPAIRTGFVFEYQCRLEGLRRSLLMCFCSRIPRSAERSFKFIPKGFHGGMLLPVTFTDPLSIPHQPPLPLLFLVSYITQASCPYRLSRPMSCACHCCPSCPSDFLSSERSCRAPVSRVPLVLRSRCL